MKKISKILITLLLVMVALFGITGCNAETQKQLQSKIDELQTQIEEMEERFADMEEQIKERDERIEDLEDGLADMEDLMGINYKVTYEGQYGQLGQKNYISICNSNNELMQLCTDNNYGFYDEESRYYESPMGRMIRNYTDNFFKRKSLVVCAFTESAYFGPLKVSSVEVVEKTLTLKINRPDSDTASDVVVSWMFIIEVTKSMVLNATSSIYLFI